MTTLAIIGGGIAGTGLLYTLAKEQKQFEKIVLFHADQFFSPCTLSSTAVVSPRGVTRGHSPLGDLIVDGFEYFRNHFSSDNPDGVVLASQYSCATKKLDQFKKRYPNGKLEQTFFKEEIYTSIDEAYLISPDVYTKWLLDSAKKNLLIEVVSEPVVDLSQNSHVNIKTLSGVEYQFDKVVVCCGNYNRFWKELSPEELVSSKPVQGSYLEWECSLPHESFSLTLNGENLIWNKKTKRLLLGATTIESHLLLPNTERLKQLYNDFSSVLNFSLPDFDQAIVKTGLREKAKKRAPYVAQSGNIHFIGGLYKNGFILSLKISKNFSHQYL